MPGIHFNDALSQRLVAAGNEDLSEFFMDFCQELAEENQAHVCGFHVISGITPLLGLRLVERLRSTLVAEPTVGNDGSAKDARAAIAAEIR